MTVSVQTFCEGLHSTLVFVLIDVRYYLQFLKCLFYVFENDFGSIRVRPFVRFLQKFNPG
jgi:hypothetical protein